MCVCVCEREREMFVFPFRMSLTAVLGPCFYWNLSTLLLHPFCVILYLLFPYTVTVLDCKNIPSHGKGVEVVAYLKDQVD